jgi:hypothetical protein
MVIDLYGLEADEVREHFPAVYQWVLEHVKPERDHNNRESYRKNWWILGEPRSNIRPALANLPRFIATPVTAKHRFFVFLDASILPDDALILVAIDDAYHLGVLSSRIHVTWALAAGGRLGVGNDPRYNKSRCFEPFPVPAADDAQQARIRAVAEELDKHRKRQQAAHPRLTLTDMYNVLAKLRAGEPLDTKDKTVHEQGLVSVLRQLHDELDALVAAAYGWPADLSEDEILARLVALNAERAAEEAAGVVRWLRPEYQAPSALRITSYELPAAHPTPLRQPTADPTIPLPWPERLAEQAQAVRAALVALDGPATAEQVAALFVDAPAARVAEMLEMLAGLGQTTLEEGRYLAA